MLSRRRDAPGISLQGWFGSYTLLVDPCEQDVARLLASLGPLPPPRRAPALVVLSGLPGSGKSTIARELCGRVPVALVQSDRVRKLLVPVPSYSTEESVRVFGTIHAALERLLADGIPAILDATTLRDEQRAPLAAIARRTGARLILVWVYAPDAVARRRLAARHAGGRTAGDLSDADVSIYEMMRERMEPIRGPHWRINTARSTERILDALARRIAGRTDDQALMRSGAARTE
jgi:predicted kinase